MRDVDPSNFTYVITKDIVETIEKKKGLPLSEPGRKEIRKLENMFVQQFWSCIPTDIRRVSLNASDVGRSMDALLAKETLPVVSLDRIYVDEADKYLEITRVTDPQTGDIRIAQRPGYPDVDWQIGTISDYDRVVLADVGAFDGTTLTSVCSKIEEAGVEIDKIWLGLSSYAANDKINQDRDLRVLNLFEFYEWIELRDLLGIDGRRVPGDSDAFMPYWENLGQWATIVKDQIDIVDDLCRTYSGILQDILVADGISPDSLGRQVPYGLEERK